MNFRPGQHRFASSFDVQLVLRYFLLRQVSRVHDRTTPKTDTGKILQGFFLTFTSTRVNFETNPCGRRSSCNSGLGPRVSGRPDLSFRSMARDQHPFVFTRGQPRRCSWMLCTMNRNKSAEPVSHSPKKGEITGQSETCRHAPHAGERHFCSQQLASWSL